MLTGNIFEKFKDFWVLSIFFKKRKSDFSALVTQTRPLATTIDQWTSPKFVGVRMQFLRKHVQIVIENCAKKRRM